jgi:hypothetical protein
MRLYLKNTKVKKAEGTTQVVEFLPRKHKALSSKPHPAKKTKKE